ncbi:MAG: 2'-5' RNA ligase [Bacteroidetes bacterium GWF2_43_63]|nr:MAG: 2'-5' RNA ligase [Bacteroidetes bacterium GWE2_42_42]OFY52902.1 MAG: 2'-5' RNA ligase [Bacteroidetes bacterium GWF2_43_63]HBG70109.1 RNA 2',3'-cyclic phosphodiesterase [Bacteroidales bacterium]HCB62284.1 RNA 2',3'-cyclic phosphodiesterase [Bacteroidales bacterium]
MIQRLFIAFDVVPSETLSREYDKLRLIFSRDRFSWARLNQMHMTLKFLGETSSDKIPIIREAMLEAFDGESAAAFSLDSLGVFGSSYAPKVLWTHVVPEDQCRIWFDKLKSSLLSRGFEYDRQNFVPHLTLARIKSIADRKVLNETVVKYKDFCFAEFRVQEIVLYESLLKPTGAEYIRHFSVSLY